MSVCLGRVSARWERSTITSRNQRPQAKRQQRARTFDTRKAQASGCECVAWCSPIFTCSVSVETNVCSTRARTLCSLCRCCRRHHHMLLASEQQTRMHRRRSHTFAVCFGMLVRTWRCTWTTIPTPPILHPGNTGEDVPPPGRSRDS